MNHWQELADRYFMNTGGRRLRVTLVRGQEARVWDDQGKGYLDFIAGWAVDSLGHCHPAMVEALTEQGRNLLQVSNDCYSVPQVQLAELLIQNSCLNRIFLCNSGAEANEGAIKLARKYGKLHLDGAYEVITALNSFHGRTLAMVAATGHHRFQSPYTPLPEGFVNVEYDDVEAIQRATTSKTCAVMLEPIQGEGGVNIPDPNYLRGVEAWCQEKGILLILDEVQTGIGRIGTLFGYQQFGVEPDIMTLAKGMGGGIPIGAFLAKEAASVFAPGDHGSTYGGNPLACAVSHAVVKFVIENDIPAQVRRVGEHLQRGLDALKSKFDFVTDVRGRGLLLAMEFDSEVSSKVVSACLEEGLLLNPVKPNAIRIMPPLIITEGEADEAVGILEKVLAKVGEESASAR